VFCHPGAEESFFIFRISRCRGRRDGRPISVSNPCYSRASAGAGFYSQPVIEFDFHCPGRRCSLENRRHHPFALMVRAVPLWKQLPRIVTLVPPAAGTGDEHPSRRNSGTHSRPPANHPCQIPTAKLLRWTPPSSSIKCFSQFSCPRAHELFSLSFFEGISSNW
jgi:hypothetical protein